MMLSKDDLPTIARSFCTLICGAGVGMFLAVAFVPKDDRDVFHLSYFVTAWLLILSGSVLRSMTGLLRRKDAEKNVVHEKPVV